MFRLNRINVLCLNSRCINVIFQWVIITLFKNLNHRIFFLNFVHWKIFQFISFPEMRFVSLEQPNQKTITKFLGWDRIARTMTFVIPLRGYQKRFELNKQQKLLPNLIWIEYHSASSTIRTQAKARAISQNFKVSLKRIACWAKKIRVPNTMLNISGRNWNDPEHAPRSSYGNSSQMVLIGWIIQIYIRDILQFRQVFPSNCAKWERWKRRSNRNSMMSKWRIGEA